MKTSTQLIFSFIFLLFFSNALQAQTIYVDIDATGANDGTSWANAYTDLQDAIDDANVGTYPIWVAEGTYYPTTTTDRTISFLITKDIQLYGGFDGTETSLTQRNWELNPTTLSGDIGVLNDNTDNAHNVVYIDGTTANGNITTNCILDGLQIVNGNSTGAAQPGAAIFINASTINSECSPSITNCVVANNTSNVNFDGAVVLYILNSGSASPVFNNVSFENNSGFSVYNLAVDGTLAPSFNDCDFLNNAGGIYNILTSDNGIYSNTISGCHFENNAQALYTELISSNGTVTLDLNTSSFIASTSSAVFLKGQSSSQAFNFSAENCVFKNNNSFDGGAIYMDEATLNASIINCLFEENGSTNEGGAVYLDNDSETNNFKITNCTLYKNTAGNRGGACYIGAKDVIISNSIFWENRSQGSVDDIFDLTALNLTVIWYSLFESASCPTNFGLNCSSNFYNQNPLFVDPSNGDFTLSANSPALDQGISTLGELSGVTTDLSGNPRIASINPSIDLIDIGAYETQLPTGPDTDMDGLVDEVDNCPITSQNNTSLHFDGMNDVVEIQDSDEISLTNDFTIEAWVNISDFTNQNGIVSKTSNGLAAPFDFYLKSGNGRPIISIGDGTTVTNSEAIASPVAGQWSHIAIVKNGNQIVQYLNGQFNGDQTLSFNPDDNNSVMNIGVGGLANSNMLGNIDELRIWNISRTAQEIKSTLLSELVGDEPGLVSYFNFNEGMADMDNTALPPSVNDNSPFSNPGVLMNFALDGITSNWTSSTIISFLDSDNDGNGDGCDICIGFDDNLDDDADGVPNGCDICLTGDDDLDMDADGVPNACDLCEGFDDNLDDDADGVPNDCDLCEGFDDNLDDDADGVPNGCDICEGYNDTIDSDADGVPDGCDLCQGSQDGMDTDMDGVPDGCDLCEGSNDTMDDDLDGIPNDCDNCPSIANVGLNFDRIDDVVEIQNATNIPIGNSAYTVEAWIYPTSLGGHGIVAWGEYGSDSRVNALRLDGNGFVHYWWSDDLFVSIDQDITNSWHHVATTYDGTTRSLYLDGFLIGSDMPSIPLDVPNANNLTIGKSFDNEYFDGSIDEVRIWNVARTSGEIIDNMHTELEGDDPTLVLNIRFNEGVIGSNNSNITQLIDNSQYGNNGTPIGFNQMGNNSNWVAGAPVKYLDADEDGSGDGCDLCADFNDSIDDDGDGVPDACDQCEGADIDSDDDGEADCVDICDGFDDNIDPDNDGVPSGCDICEGFDDAIDTDNDGVPNGCDICEGFDDNIDTDNDGVADCIDICLGSNDLEDTDSDGIPDGCDECPTIANTLDTDGDGVPDCFDSCPSLANTVDSDGDGNPDCFDNCPTLQNIALNFNMTSVFGAVASADSVTVNHSEELSLTNDFTLEGWVNIISYSRRRGIISKTMNGVAAPFDYHMAQFNGRPILVLGDGINESFVSAVAAPPVGQWRHVAVVKEGNTITHYLNGEFNGSGQIDFIPEDLNDNVIIGADDDSGAIMDGSMDNIRVWNRARTQSEIKSLMNQESEGFIPNLVASYTFNEGVPNGSNSSLTTIIDKSGNDNTGTLKGFARNGTLGNWVVGPPINHADTDGDGIGSECDTPAENPSDYFYASNGLNDASIELGWRIDPSCFETSSTGDQLFNFRLKKGNSFLQNINITLPAGQTYEGTYTDIVGPDQSHEYSIQVYRPTDIIPNCTLEQIGSTLPFQEPELISISDNIYPDKTTINWTNNSSLSDEYNIYRNGTLIETLTGPFEIGETITYTDAYDFENPTESILNGATYQYCIETESNIVGVDQLSPQLCDYSTTIPINFSATINTFPAKVDLIWDDMSAHCDLIKVVRDGQEIAQLIPSTISYSDENPIFGQLSTYGVILVKNETDIVADYDIGSVNSNGTIAGKVLTTEGLYPVPGVNIQLSGIVGSTIINETTNTDLAGAFTFSEVFYGELNSFTVKAIPNTNQEFEIDSTMVELSTAIPTYEDVLFLEKTGFESGEMPPVINSFNTSPDPTGDLVTLDWNYDPNPTKITYFNLFRDATLIGQLSDYGIENQTNFTLNDLGGLDSTEYTYRLTAYYLESNIVNDTSTTVIDTFPNVTIPTLLNATANETLGTVDLDWEHTSNNFNQFRIYRNGDLIATTNNTTTTYVDESGSSATPYTYSITAYRTIGEADRESEHRLANPVTFPDLLEVDELDFTLMPMANEDMVEISWTVPNGLNANYNFDGFRLYRTPTGGGASVLILEKDKQFIIANTTDNFFDKTGIPNISYEYELKTFSETNESNGIAKTTTFPAVSIASGGTANELPGKIELAWNSPHSSDNYNGFIIYRDYNSSVDSIGFIEYQYNNEYKDYINNPPFDNAIDYEIRTLRIVNGSSYYSDPMTINAGPPTLDTDLIQDTPYNFTASDDQSNHIKLCWDTDVNSILEIEFELKREGVVIATLDKSARTYYDYDAPIGENIEYSIQIKYQTYASATVYTAGQMLSTQYLTGRVFKQNSGQGIANANLMITGNNGSPIQQNVQTDSAGYYSLNLLPSSTAYTLSVEVQADNSDFATNPQSISISPTENEFVLDFIDTFEATSSDEVAEIIAVTATPYPAIMEMMIAWSPDSDHYDGFQVYRGTELIEEVLRGQELTYADDSGIPGILEAYQVRAFIFQGSNRIYSDYKGAIEVFPGLLPVQNLATTPYYPEINQALPDSDNRVIITWSHPYDNVDAYFVERNGLPFDVVESGEILQAIDSTGVPEQLYQYTVKALKGTQFSEQRSVSSHFPKVKEVTNLQASSPLDSYGSTMNHQLLTWDYQEGAADAFEIYRDDMLIAKIESTSDQNQSYQYFDGIPETEYTYSVKAIIKRAGVEYSSNEATVIGTFPAYAFPVNFEATPVDAMGWVTLEFNYLYPSATHFNLYRQVLNSSVQVLIGTVQDTTYGLDNTKSFIDLTGDPGQAYIYLLEAVTIREGNIITSERINNGLILGYPFIPIPTNFTASDNVDYNAIYLNWEYEESINIDQFRIEKKEPEGIWVLLDIVDAGVRNYTDTYNINLTTDDNVNYRIRAQRNFTEISGWVEDEGSAEVINSTSFVEVIPVGAFGVAIDDEFAILRTSSSTLNRYTKTYNWGNLDVINNPESISGGSNFGLDFDAKNGFSVVSDGPNSQIYVNPWDVNGEILNNPNGVFANSISDDGNSIIVEGSDVKILAKDAMNNFSEVTSYNQAAITDVSITSHLAAILNDNSSGTSSIKLYENNNPSGSIPNWQAIPALNETSGVDFTFFMHLATNPNSNESYLIVTGMDQVYLYTYNHSTGFWSTPFVIDFPSIANAPLVKVTSQGYAIIEEGAEDVDGNLKAGAVYVYKKETGNQWNFLKKLIEPTPISFNNFGDAIDAYNNQLIVRAKNNTYIYQLDKIFLVPANNISATQGTSSNTTITWDYNGEGAVIDEVSGFRIYRSDAPSSVLATVTSGISVINNTFTDANPPIAGKKYTYKVIAFNTNGIESDPVAAVGWNKADGSISGIVQTQLGSAPVPNVVIEARAVIDGEVYTYTTTSNVSSGTNFEFTELYKGANTAEYQLTPSFEDHEFVDVAPINLSSAPVTGVTIFDKTAYVLSGTVRHADVANCAIEGVKIKAIHTVNGVDQLPGNGQETTTAADGSYSLVLNPTQLGLERITIEIEEESVIDSESSMETIFHDFEFQGNPIFTDFSDFPTASVLDVYDVTRYQVDVKAQTTCETAISNAVFTVRARTLDGCYEQYFDLLPNGEGILMLPPLDIVLNVAAVNSSSSDDIIALNYLKNNPVSIDLYNMHLELEGEDPSPQQIIDNKRNFTYHKPPQITIDPSSFDRYLCDDNNRPAIIEQTNDYTVNITVQEDFSPACAVKEGYLIINNAASVSSTDTLYIDTTTGEIPPYEFEAGTPNLIAPHLWSMQVAYYAASGVFQGSTSQTFLVEGQVALPGNDVIVDPVGGDNLIQMPLFVLRDPPGDQSYSTISQGQTFESSFSTSNEQGAGAGVYFNSSLEVGPVGFTASASTSAGGSEVVQSSLDVSISTTQTYSTSSELIGREADVIVGVGMAMQYGFVREISVSEETCDQVNEIVKLGFTPNSIATNWVYNVGFIESLIAGYEEDIINITSGDKVLKNSAGTEYSTEEALKLVESWIYNWKQVLDFHDTKSNPFYVMCSQDYTTNDEGVPELLSEANEWRDGFCELIGTNPGPDFELDTTQLNSFDSLLLDSYNHTSWAILQLTDPTNQTIGLLEFATSYVESVNPNFPFSVPLDSPVGNSTLVGPMAKNYTLSGGAGEVVFETEQVQTSTKSYSQNAYVENSVSAGLLVNTDIVTFAGLGFGVITKFLDFQFEAGVTTDLSMNISESRTQTISNSAISTVVLDDDDDGDQFNVTILKSMAPNHTPYFMTLGGRSSCPPEEGAIARDVPMIQVISPGDTVAALVGNQFFIEPDGVAEFELILDNSNVFGEDRDLVVFLENGTNPDGAIFQLAGQSLGELTFNPAGQANPILSITRGPSAYTYEGVRVGVRPACEEDDETVEYITLNFSFQTPCSPVTMVTPDDNWLMNTTNDELLITIRDYDINNPLLKHVELQYRRLGAGSEWEIIPTNYLAEQNNPVIKDSLTTHNSNFGIGQVPEYFFSWQLPEDLTTFPDGDYELRVMALCEEGPIVSKTYSNIRSGKIDRNGLRLFGVPEPADGVWVSGDQITATFNKNLNCPLMDDPVHQANYFNVEANGNAITNASFVCLNSQIQMTLPDMSLYDGQVMTVTLDSVVSVNGSVARDVSWSFVVVTQDLYWVDNEISLELYEGESVDITTYLQSISFNLQSDLYLEREPEGVNSDDWLTSFTPSTSFDLGPLAFRAVTFSLTGTTEGTYTENIQVKVDSDPIASVAINLIVRPEPPYPPDWTVDGGEYPNSMTILANYQYLGTDTLSKDTMDQISVWIDGEQRGLGKIQNVEDDFFVSYLTVYGNANDQGKAIEFRVWDASTDSEYDAHPLPDTITYRQDNFVGTTAQPTILYIDTAVDSARYITLNDGYTWISLNTVESDMSVPYLLRGIQNVTEGDYILSGDGKFTEYLDNDGWYVSSANSLDSLNTKEGYMVYLENGPDQFRMTGAPAAVESIFLNEGWTWVGYPLDYAQDIEDAITISPMIVPETDSVTFKTKEYGWTDQIGPDLWGGASPNDQVTPQVGYKVYIDKPAALLSYNHSQLLQAPGHIFSNKMMPPNPNEPSTWVLESESYNFQDNIPLVAEVLLGGVKIENTDSKIAVFVDDEIRGFAQIENNIDFNTHLINLVIGQNKDSEVLRILYWDADLNVIFELDPVPALTDVNGKSLYTFANIGELDFDACYGVDTDNDSVPDNCDQCPGFDDTIDDNMNGIPDGCETCEITDAGLIINACENGNYSILLNPSGTNVGMTCDLTGDGFTGTYTLTYGQPSVINYLQDTLNILLTDVGGNCSLPITVDAPYGCSGDNDCTEDNLVFDNQILPTGEYKAIQSILSQSIIEDPSNVIFKAGNEILLESGFEVQIGVDFEAIIETCGGGGSP